ncbi:Branched-chain amino acid transport system permease protein LivM [Euzebya pacifica]|uniref:Branched-chain amino acid transport system permease protein LivM n=2 Tax=Euzebya pacifica TaxID=1608957 RepID=A0A346XYV6_9ACTN|nr:Branched-chain amino acid transport system permease protein LivM [Euzebya pacifica]
MSSMLFGGSGVGGRPELYTSYDADMALFNTRAKLWSVQGLVLLAALLPFVLADDLLVLLSRAFAFAVGAIGLNLVTGYAGQVSLGHAVFVGIGAFTAAALSGDPDGRTLGFGLPMIVWLPAAALLPAAVGALIAPLATRLRGLYLAIVTLGLVFIGDHIFREADFITGGFGVGRPGVVASVFGVSLTDSGPSMTGQQKTYFFALVVLVVVAILGRNIARTAVGRAFQAVRDRDIAAEVIGVELTKHKVLAFTVSSAFAGLAGALLYTITRQVVPESFSLLLSVQFIAMILIGGASTISGSIAGAVFLTVVLRLSEELSRFFSFIPSPGQQGGLLNTAQVSTILYGFLIVGFLLFEPRGLFGVWIRIRNYWKGWPFSY